MAEQEQTDQKQKIDTSDNVMEARNVSVYYDGDLAVRDVTMDVPRNKITALIGPSGCGKSTVIRCFNRMNDLIEGARVEGEIIYRGRNLYAGNVDPVEVRRRVGMVFQKPNPFPKSIYDNVAYGPRLLGLNDKDELDDIVENSLRGAAIWDEVKGNLDKNGLELSGGQQQRLCIARTIAVDPEVILMDEPASALDPIATQRIEETMRELQKNYTIIIVTHNMQQAQRASDFTAFFNIRKEEKDDGSQKRWGELVEYAPTDELFNNPQNQETHDYISGRFG
jgi:phosphate transport system ATP-binding protein